MAQKQQIFHPRPGVPRLKTPAHVPCPCGARNGIIPETRAWGLPGSGTQHDTTKITRDGEPDLNTTKITRDGRDSPIGDGAGRTSKLNSQKDHGPLPAGVSARHGSRAEWPGTGVLDLTLVLRTRTGALEVKGETFTRLTPNFSVKVTFTVLLKRSDRTDTARNEPTMNEGKPV